MCISLRCRTSAVISISPIKILLNSKHLQHLIAVMIDHLHSDLAGLGPVKRAASGRVQFRPSRFIYLGLERPLRLLIGIIAAGKISMADKEHLAVVVGINESASNISSGVAMDLPGSGIVDVQPFDVDLNLAISTEFDESGFQVYWTNPRFAENHD